MEYFIDDLARMERLKSGTATAQDQLEAAIALEEADLYEDVYNNLTEIIEPYVQRVFIRTDGGLPASVVHSVEYLLKFWLENRK